MTAVTVREKDPDVDITYALDWEEFLVDVARRAFDFDLGAVVRAPNDTGWYYECTTAGRTASNPPTFPRAAGETVQDGSVVWTCRHPDTPTIRTIASAAWTVPSGLTKESQSEDGPITYVTLSGGTDGEDYDLVCRMTPSSGNPIERTIIVPVRSQ